MQNRALRSMKLSEITVQPSVSSLFGITIDRELELGERGKGKG